MEKILEHWQFIVGFMLTVLGILFADNTGKNNLDKKGK